MVKTWSAKQLRFIDFLANPDEHRTKREFAEVLGVHEVTLCKWQNKEGFQDEVSKRAMIYLNIAFPEFLAALKKMAKKGNVDAIKLALQQLGKLVEKVQEEVRVKISWDEEE